MLPFVDFLLTTVPFNMQVIGCCELCGPEEAVLAFVLVKQFPGWAKVGGTDVLEGNCRCY